MLVKNPSSQNESTIVEPYDALRQRPAKHQTMRNLSWKHFAAREKRKRGGGKGYCTSYRD
uniref:Uncharacterized protein n=1 Tax=Rhizophora mucronata TaxID=61149 RepID=A0A2P2MCZ9_RHIMU